MRLAMLSGLATVKLASIIYIYIFSTIVQFLSATLWAFLLTVTKVSTYVPYDLLVLV